MNIQLALDRYTIEEAIEIAKSTEGFIDWIEVGTSLIKEYGMVSVEKLKNAFPNKVIVADIKTIDNAYYEFDMCFRSGADVATVMGVSPAATINACIETAEKAGKRVMVDLLNTNDSQQKELFHYKQAIFCAHVSKDEQEIAGKQNIVTEQIYDPTVQLAVAGGITLDSIASFRELQPNVVIIGSAITKAKDKRLAAKQFKKVLLQWNGERKHENIR
ncbi:MULTISPECIES: 3-hexulose-6-phosphate synthase [Metabacillus]|uniref:3-hexulose-6-phosphate synthase n=2 Tax=Metabacillus TaxID=2675233 RepID=A0A179T5Z4_9BACI|nr:MULTISPECIES: 3-hexulose-6-phosphate synthase [Metabacillus]OAS89496.1 3-hexulose-6-phosphate synthase [Metabacillus litoralis]QNF29018.1 orotidine 5'-phosphate decarboxylase [Metabacillus sp. KUDC1714]